MSEYDEWTNTPEFSPEPDAEEPIQEELAEDDQPEQVVLDLNQAKASELRKLPGIGKVLAARIIGHRTEVEPFKDPSEITQVKGISQAMYEQIADRLTAGPMEPESWPGWTRTSAEIEFEEEMPEAIAEERGTEAGEAMDEQVTEGLEEEAPEVVAGAIEEGIIEAPEPEIGEEIEVEFAGMPEIEQVVKPEPEEAPDRPKMEKRPSRGPEPPLVEVQTIQKAGWGRLLFMGALCTLLGAALALAVLFFTNGTLDFQASANRALRTESARLQEQVDTLDSQQATLEQRLQALQDLTPALAKAQSDIEGLGLDLASAQARMDRAVEDLAEVQASLAGLENRTGGIEAQVSELQAQASAMQEQIEALEGDIETLQAAAGRFDSFLTGLRELLSPEEATSPQLTPMPETPEAEESPTAEPGITVMPTVQPRITVIPLATPTPTPSP